MKTASASPLVPSDQRDPVYQISTLQALVMGNYYGCLEIQDLLTHGNTGLGTFDAVDGELVIIDGHCYRIIKGGKAIEARPHDTTPFASVAFLDEETNDSLKFDSLTSVDALRHALDEYLENRGPNNMYVMRVDGYFHFVAARTELRQQEPFKPFAEVLQKDEDRFRFNSIHGTLICFYFPKYLDGVNTPGWHFHFIDDARKVGGHVFDLHLVSGRAIINKTDRFVLDLPHNRAFQEAALDQASKDDIRQIEQGAGN